MYLLLSLSLTFTTTTTNCNAMSVRDPTSVVVKSGQNYGSQRQHDATSRGQNNMDEIQSNYGSEPSPSVSSDQVSDDSDDSD